MAFLASFSGGMLSYLTPCVLLLLPVYFGVMGLRGHSLETRLGRVLFFVAGFTGAFLALGVSAAAMAEFLRYRSALLELLAGVALILLGLHQMGLFRLAFRRPATEATGWDFTGFRAALLGMFFALGWGPCVEPILSALLARSAPTAPAMGSVLFVVFALGVAVPLVVFAVLSEGLWRALARRAWAQRLEPALGALVVLVGVLFATGRVEAVTGWGGGVAWVEQQIAPSPKRTAALPQEMRVSLEPLQKVVLLDGRRFVEASSWKLLLVNFWAPWCPPCRAEIPDLIALYEKYQPKGLEILGIAEDSVEEDVRSFVKDWEIPYPVAMSPEVDFGRSLGMPSVGIPRSILFDREGKVLYRVIGIVDTEKLEALLQQHLG